LRVNVAKTLSQSTKPIVAYISPEGVDLAGGPDDDVITGSPFDDTFRGDGGNDHIRGGNCNNDIQSGHEDFPGSDSDTIFGELGDNKISGWPDSDFKTTRTTTEISGSKADREGGMTEFLFIERLKIKRLAVKPKSARYVSKKQPSSFRRNSGEYGRLLDWACRAVPSCRTIPTGARNHSTWGLPKAQV
jgi:hypothetical protein